MPNIQFKRGADGATLPPLKPGEPAMLGENLYVGDVAGSPVRLATAGELEGKANKSTKLSKNISAAWMGKAAPYMQMLSVAGVNAASIVEIGLAANATLAQVKAYQALNLQDGGQSTGTVILKAFGEKNAEILPITVILRGDA